MAPQKASGARPREIDTVNYPYDLLIVRPELPSLAAEPSITRDYTSYKTCYPPCALQNANGDLSSRPYRRPTQGRRQSPHVDRHHHDLAHVSIDCVQRLSLIAKIMP